MVFVSLVLVAIVNFHDETVYITEPPEKDHTPPNRLIYKYKTKGIH